MRYPPRLTRWLARLVLVAGLAHSAMAQTTTDQLNKLSLESLTQGAPARPSVPYSASAPRRYYGPPRVYRGHPHRYGLHRGRPPYRHHRHVQPRHHR